VSQAGAYGCLASVFLVQDLLEPGRPRRTLTIDDGEWITMFPPASGVELFGQRPTQPSLLRTLEVAVDRGRADARTLWPIRLYENPCAFSRRTSPTWRMDTAIYQLTRGRSSPPESYIVVQTCLSLAAGAQVAHAPGSVIVRKLNGVARAWRPLRRGITDPYRRAEVSRTANERYLGALAGIADPTVAVTPVLPTRPIRRPLVRSSPVDPLGLLWCAARAEGRARGSRTRDADSA
jgi:hypothetical protein